MGSGGSKVGLEFRVRRIKVETEERKTEEEEAAMDQNYMDRRKSK